MSIALESTQPLEDQVNEIWARKISRLPIYKDLPRLAGRISLESTTNKSVNYNPWDPTPASTSGSASDKKARKSTEESERKSLKLRLSCIEFDKMDADKDKLEILDNDTTNEKIWKRLKKIIFKLTECFETEEVLKLTRTTFNNYPTPTDFELHMSTLLKTCFNEESKTIKILKLIHQNIIYIGCFEIKAKVPFLMNPAHMTKDVRGPEGWRISILETKDIVTVTHSRREESLPTQPKDRQFWFEWQLTIILNRELTQITSSTLKIVQLHFQPGINPAFKDEVNRYLCSGNLFVA